MSAKPWHRREGETEAAYAAFRGYLDLGPGRSIAEAWRRTPKGSEQAARGHGDAPRHYHRWVERWQWVARAGAFDQHQQEATSAAMVKATATEAEKWERRRQKAREADYEMARRLAKAALEVLASLNPDDAKWRDLSTLAATASKLRALALGEPTERVEQSGTVEHRGVQVVLTADDLKKLDATSLTDIFDQIGREE